MVNVARIIELYQEMYELTEPECRNSCNCPQSCCSPEYCTFAMDWAERRWNTTLKPTGHKTLPLMGSEGCTALPHYRPFCTVHTCDVGAFGFKMHPKLDPEWDKKYWDIRNEIDELEAQRLKDDPLPEEDRLFQSLSPENSATAP